jgi:hypothetical protein
VAGRVAAPPRRVPGLVPHDSSPRPSPPRHARGCASAKARGEEDDGSRYYLHWLSVLEKLAVQKCLVPGDELAVRKREWDEVARSTPHGRPIELDGADKWPMPRPAGSPSAASSPLSSLAPHQPRPACDAPHALERRDATVYRSIGARHRQRATGRSSGKQLSRSSSRAGRTLGPVRWAPGR